MAELRHTVMSEDMSLVNARAYGATRDSATILAALTVIGSRVCTLILIDEGDGIWTLTTDLSIPSNVILQLPAGVTLVGVGNLTILGDVLALRTDWFQGTGMLTWSASTMPFVTASLLTHRLHLGTEPGETVTLQSAPATSSWTWTLPPTPGAANHVLLSNGAGVTTWGAVVPSDPTLAALAGLTTGADRYIYFTDVDQAATGLVTSYSRGLLTNDDASSWRQALGAAGNGAAYITSTASTELTQERVLTDTPTVSWDFATANQGKAHVVALSIGTTHLADLSVTTGKLQASSVTYAKVQNIAAGRLLGNSTASPGTMQEISLGAGLTLNASVLSVVPAPPAPAGATTQVQYNAAGVMAGSSGLTLSATQVTALTFAPTVALSCERIGLGMPAPTLPLRLEVAGNVSANIMLSGYFDAWDKAGSSQYAFIGRMSGPGGTERWNCYMLGNAPNYFAGALVFGDATSTRNNLGLGTIAVQNSNNVSITGGNIGGLLGIGANDVSCDGDRFNVSSATHNVRISNRLVMGAATGLASKIDVVWDKTSQCGFACLPGGDAGAFPLMDIRNGVGSVIGSISQTSTNVAFNTSSDARLKHAVQALTGALAAIQGLNPVRFRWNADDSQDEGFLAHELQQVVPHAVTGEPDAVHDDGTIRPQQVDHSKLVVWLVGSIQELLARVEALEATA